MLMHAGSRMLPPKRFGWDQGQGGCRGAAGSAWELRGARPRAKRLCHGVTSLEKPIPTHLSWEQLVSTYCPQEDACGGARKGFALCLLLLALPKGSGFWGGLEQLQYSYDCPHLGCVWSFWVAQMLGDIPKPIGQINSLSERGSKPATSYAGWVKVVSGKLFPPSAEIFPFRREHEVRDISQDPDISCLLFPSCSSDWCQRPSVARFPVTSSNHVLGKLVGVPARLCVGMSQEDPAEDNLLCPREVVVTSVVGAHGCGGPQEAPNLQMLGSAGRRGSLRGWDGNPTPLCWL